MGPHSVNCMVSDLFCSTQGFHDSFISVYQIILFIAEEVLLQFAYPAFC